MLPSLKFVVCGILFCVLVFAVTGAGVMLPDSRTRIGEMPEIGRPMMQRSMADIPIQPQVYMATIARRSDDAEHLREAAPVEVAPTQPEPDQPLPDALKTDTTPRTDRSPPDLPKPEVRADVLAATAASDGATTANATPNPTMNPASDGAPPGEGGATSARAAPAEGRRDDRTDEAGPPQQVATLAPVIEEEGAPIPRYVNVPLPPPRPTAVRRHVRVLHYRRRPVQQYDTANPAGQAVPSGSAASMIPGVAAGYTPAEAAGRQSR